MSSAIKGLLLPAAAALFFVTEIIPLAITATGAAVACGVLGHRQREGRYRNKNCRRC
ncbi:MAG: hypothetical protein SPI71_00290 [Acidaminococcaceae bacterium]|nr:hypothetical protein [Acidaminococcaceae bacterium]